MTTVLAVADADSYLKWSAATLDRLPADWVRRQLVITSPTTPSVEQSIAATGSSVPRISLLGLRSLLRRDPPDVLLLACTGPTVGVLTGLRALRGRDRPVLVTGLPGISVPASARAVQLRRDCDLLVVHSTRERDEFTRLAADLAPGLQVALSRLPFLSEGAAEQVATGGAEVVFAAQAKVPPARADREQILLALAGVEPPGSAVVKVRAAVGEQQTHAEQHPYPDLFADLVAAGRVAPDAVRFRTGAMAGALDGARSLATVSSTAALESMAAGVPVLVLSDFGVDAAMINEVFQGSGCLGTLADLRAGRAYHPDPLWCEENYFHRPSENDLVERLQRLLDRRSGAGLPARQRAVLTRSGLRSLARLVLPAPVTELVRRVRAGRTGCGPDGSDRGGVSWGADPPAPGRRARGQRRRRQVG